MTKLIIIGHAQHGKDTVAEILLGKYGVPFESSSEAACRLFMFDALKGHFGYDSQRQCFEDRVNHRDAWGDGIAKYNEPDPTKLARGIFADSDVYCGMRRERELNAVMAAGLADFIVWVDASKRKPLEPETSMQLHTYHADWMIDNNGPEEDLERHIDKMASVLLK
jgi:hypothetical protein